MKKVCILTCGGTITMKRNNTGVLVPFYEGKVLLKKIPDLVKIAQITLKEITNSDSTNIDSQIWSKLAYFIKENYSTYDAFVITHGTDTMAYTASALSFALGNLDKPVIFTGSQKPIDDIPTDAKDNLINSVLVATYNIPSVVIVFGPKILQANRTTKVSESNLDAFDSPMVSAIGEISLEPKFNNLRKKTTRQNILSYKPDFGRDVISIVLTPGLNAMHLAKLLNDCNGIILEAFGPGNIPEELLTFLNKAQKLNKPVVIISQCKRGVTKMQLYEVGFQALKYGSIPGGDMTLESAVTKLMWLLGQTKDLNKIKQAFKKSYAGEVTV